MAADLPKLPEPPLPWRPIHECPDSDDLFWFMRGDTIDGPRTSSVLDVDYWDWFAPCTWPSTLSRATAEQAACSCPSGDGSLRWPCPVHPAEQAGKVEDVHGNAVKIDGEWMDYRDAKPTQPAATPDRDEYAGAATLLQAMVRNYRHGHCWDHLDAKACTKAADAIIALLAVPAATQQPVATVAASAKAVSGTFIIAADAPADIAAGTKLYAAPISPSREVEALLSWAVERWHAEVASRPMVNIHRRSLDDCWRQVIRRLGEDDVSLIGPRHDDLLAPVQEKSNG